MLLFNELHRMNKTTENTFVSTCISTKYSFQKCHWIVFTLFYSYTQTYNDNVSQSIYLLKLEVLPLNIKSPVYLNKSSTNTFCRRGYGVKENDSSICFCRITIHAFNAGDLNGSNNCRTTFTNLTVISSFKVIMF